MKKVIIIIIGVLLLITTISIIGLNKMGDEIIDGLIDNELAAIEQTNKVAEVNEASTEKAIEAIEGDNPSQTDNNATAISNGAALETGSSKVGDKEGKESIGTGLKDKAQPKVITVKKVQEIKEQVTAMDKMTAATLALKRLSTDDIEVLKDLMNGGLTAEKKKQAVKIAYARFTAEEIVQIKELYHKYMK